MCCHKDDEHGYEPVKTEPIPDLIKTDSDKRLRLESL